MPATVHKQARTPPVIRAELQASSEPSTVLARRYNRTVSTLRKWRARTDTQDRSHRPPTLHATLSPEQELVAQAPAAALDDLLVVTREFVHPKVSRSGLDRCLRRHSGSRLEDLIPREESPRSPAKTFKDYAPGFVHVDVDVDVDVKYLPQMPGEHVRHDLFAAIDRVSR